MGQPSGSWCISCSKLSAFFKGKLIFFLNRKIWLFVSVCIYVWALEIFSVCVRLCQTVISFIMTTSKPFWHGCHLFFTAINPNTESVEDLMQRFQDSFRVPNTPTDMSQYQHALHSSSTGRRRVPSHTRGEVIQKLPILWTQGENMLFIMVFSPNLVIVLFFFVHFQ